MKSAIQAEREPQEPPCGTAAPSMVCNKPSVKQKAMRFVILRVRSRPYARRSQSQRMCSRHSPQPVVQPSAPAESPLLITNCSDRLPTPAVLMSDRSDRLPTPAVSNRSDSGPTPTALMTNSSGSDLNPAALRAPAQVDSTSEARAVTLAPPGSLIPAVRTAAVSTGFSTLIDKEDTKQKPWLLKPSDLYRAASTAAPLNSSHLGSVKAVLHSGDAPCPKLLTPSALSGTSAVSSPNSQLAPAVAKRGSSQSHSSGVTATPGPVAQLGLSVQYPQASNDSTEAASDALTAVKTAQDKAAGPTVDTPQLKTEDSVVAPVADSTQPGSEDTVRALTADTPQLKSADNVVGPIADSTRPGSEDTVKAFTADFTQLGSADTVGAPIADPTQAESEDTMVAPIADSTQSGSEDTVGAPITDPTRVESEDAMTIVVVGADSCQIKSQVTSMHPVGFIAQLDRQLQASKQRLQPVRVEETGDKVITTGAAPLLPTDSNSHSQPDMQLVQDNLVAMQREVQQSVRDVGVSNAQTGAQASVKTPAKTPTPSSSLVPQGPSQHQPSLTVQPLQQQSDSLKPMLTKPKSRFAPSSTAVKAKQPDQHSKSVAPLQHELSSASPRIQAVHPQPELQPDAQQPAARVNAAVLHDKVSSESSQSLVSLSRQHTAAAGVDVAVLHEEVSSESSQSVVSLSRQHTAAVRVDDAVLHGEASSESSQSPVSLSRQLTAAAIQHEPAYRSQSTLAQPKADMHLQMGLDADSTQAAAPELQTDDQTASALQSMQHGDTSPRTPAAHVDLETEAQLASALQSVQPDEAAHVGPEPQSLSASAVQSVQHDEASNENAVTAQAEGTHPVQQQAACLVPKEEDCLNLYYDEAGNRAAAVDEARRAALMQRLAKHRLKQATPVKALDSLPHFLREVSCSH